MARIAGVDLPKNKRGEIGLTYIYGIGSATARYILDKHGIDRNKKVNEWNDQELNDIRSTINEEFVGLYGRHSRLGAKSVISVLRLRAWQ